MVWDESVDVIVVGSGNGGMTAALTSKISGADEVLVIEKASQYGGTSALSGGGVWVPNNRYAKAAGAEDSYEDAREYLRQTVPEHMVDPIMIETYLKKAPEMVDFLHDNTRVRYESLLKYPDYYTNLPGSRTGHRSMEPAPFSREELGEDADHIVEPYALMFDRIGMTQVEAQILLGKHRGWMFLELKMVLAYALDIPYRLKTKLPRRMTVGNAGVARLRASLRDQDIPLRLNCALKKLVMDGQRVTGIEVEDNGVTKRIEARRGVILAAGGFEHNQAMREHYLPSPTNTEWSAGTKTNTGDAHRAAIAIGAKTGLMEHTWWCSTVRAPGMPFPYLSIGNKSYPGSIVVNERGQRFSNESQNYMAYMKETFALHSDENPVIPHYMIWDSNFRKKYRVFPLPDRDKNIPQSFFGCGFFGMADTLEELAQEMNIDPAGLRHTVENFNRYAAEGKDPDLGRGDSTYDRYYGDPEVTPNPCLGPVNKPPFYALRQDPGDFGTQGGMVVTPNAQVLHEDGHVIERLYAIGNCAKAVLPTYPGPGSTLGPAMTFGYLAGRHITG